MKLAGLGVVSLLLQGLHFHTKSRIRDRGFVPLRQVQHALLLEPRASVPLTLTQGLELRPVCDELLRETPLRWDGARRSRLPTQGGVGFASVCVCFYCSTYVCVCVFITVCGCVYIYCSIASL